MKFIVSFSGGLDSTSLLFHLCSNNPCCKIRAYGFTYGSKHQIWEREAALKIVKILRDRGQNIDYRVIDITQCFDESQSSLSQFSNESVPEGHYADENMKSTVVENRNVIFNAILYGKALSWYKKDKEIVSVCLGAHGGDHPIYKDCRFESFAACELAFRISNDDSDGVRFYIPYLKKDKKQVVEELIKSAKLMGMNSTYIQEIISITHSCYKPDEKGVPCGKCGTCVERIEALEGLAY